VKIGPAAKGAPFRGEETRPGRSPWAPLLLLPLALIIAYFLNLHLQWTAIRQELAHGPAFRSPEYTFLGNWLFNKKEIAAARMLPNAAPGGRVFGFYDLVHPAIFLVWNNGPGDDFFDLGPVMVALPAGFSRVVFLPGSVFYILHEGGITVRYFGDAIVGRPWYASWRRQLAGKGKPLGPQAGSFVVKSPAGSPYLRIPYLVYFFLPLVLIAAAVGISGTAMMTALFYYVEMFFLFDHQNLLAAVPISWLAGLLNIDWPGLPARFIAVLLTIVFLFCSAFGLWHWRKREVSAWQRWGVLFFILLPFLLFV
jgi:hypothetical protein